MLGCLLLSLPSCLAEKQVLSAQMKEHRAAVLDLVEMYLRGEFSDGARRRSTVSSCRPLKPAVMALLVGRSGTEGPRGSPP